MSATIKGRLATQFLVLERMWSAFEDMPIEEIPDGLKHLKEKCFVSEVIETGIKMHMEVLSEIFVSKKLIEILKILKRKP